MAAYTWGFISLKPGRAGVFDPDLTTVSPTGAPLFLYQANKSPAGAKLILFF